MTNPLTIAELKALVTLMQDMQTHAESGQWETLEALDKERLNLLNRQSTEATHPASIDTTTPDYQELVELVSTLDKDIMNTILSARNKLVTESTGLRNQIKAKQNYAKANSLSLSATR